MKKRKSDAIQDQTVSPPSEADIAGLAHSHWKAESCPEGDDWRYWLRAEAELTAAAKAGAKERA